MQSQNLPHLENQTSLVALCRQLPTSRALAAPNSREQIWQAMRQGTRLSDTTMASTEAEHQSNPLHKALRTNNKNSLSDKRLRTCGKKRKSSDISRSNCRATGGS